MVKETHSRRHQQSTTNVFITATEEADGMHSANHVPPPSTTASLVGAIELSGTDNSLALAEFRCLPLQMRGIWSKCNKDWMV